MSLLEVILPFSLSVSMMVREICMLGAYGVRLLLHKPIMDMT